MLPCCGCKVAFPKRLLVCAGWEVVLPKRLLVCAGWEVVFPKRLLACACVVFAFCGACEVFKEPKSEVVGLPPDGGGRLD